MSNMIIGGGIAIIECINMRGSIIVATIIVRKSKSDTITAVVTLAVGSGAGRR